MISPRAAKVNLSCTSKALGAEQGLKPCTTRAGRVNKLVGCTFDI